MGPSMEKVRAIIVKELKAYFQSPIAYVVLLVAIAIFHVFFFMIVDQNKESTLRDIFSVMEFMFVFIVPLLTMNVFAEEKSSGTMEFLMTTPTSNTTIVMGKFLGSAIFFTLMIVLTGIYYVIIEIYGSPDRATIGFGP